MEILVASAIGLMTAVGIYLILRLRTFPVIVGLSMISYACNVFIFASGRIVAGLPPILSRCLFQKMDSFASIRLWCQDASLV